MSARTVDALLAELRAEASPLATEAATLIEQLVERLHPGGAPCQCCTRTTTIDGTWAAPCGCGRAISRIEARIWCADANAFEGLTGRSVD